ncbi:MAG TPA: vWA domain-containing protein [Planctomycetota bacterium]|nr:vWA domain-containing protein [Planctomycetota bacterium]
MVTLLATAGVLLLALVGELLHLRRVRRIARLAFGSSTTPAPWARVVPLVRVLAHGALAWGLCTLLVVEPRVHESEQIPDEEYRHLILVHDVSPSMLLRDAGVEGTQSRAERAKELIEGLFERVPIGKFKISVIATYNGAKPVVEDTKDIELVRHILGMIDMRYAFKAGPTRLFDGIEEAAKLAKPWRIRSALLVIMSDGDTVPATGMPALPPSIGGTLVIGVGDHVAGKFIAGHQSRQDASTLRQIAIRLNGEFHNGNKRHVPSDVLAAAAADSRKPLIERMTLREYALLAIAMSTALLAVLPLLLHYLGTRWRPGVEVAAAEPVTYAPGVGVPAV